MNSENIMESKKQVVYQALAAIALADTLYDPKLKNKTLDESWELLPEGSMQRENTQIWYFLVKV
ncbi:MAG: hypothetical protein LBD03_07640 [Methanobrevibacter sp.]|jgi:hypothetical protein|nr:hypothetical protein [Candidatus Methanovirga procula]